MSAHKNTLQHEFTRHTKYTTAPTIELLSGVQLNVESNH